VGTAYGSAGEPEYVQGVVGSDYKPQKICQICIGIKTGKRFGMTQKAGWYRAQTMQSHQGKHRILQIL
jgi:hypothetical protein